MTIEIEEKRWKDEHVFACCFTLAARLTGYQDAADIPPAESLRLGQLVRAQMAETAAVAKLLDAAAKGAQA